VFERRTLILLLVLMAAASGWLLYRLDFSEQLSKPKAKHDPDYYMENFVQSTMDKEGKLHHRLSADLMVHYPDDDSTELVRPVLEVYNESPTPWHITSDKGWISRNNEIVLLTGKVHMWQDDAAGQRQFDVVTRDVRILPDKQYAETSQPAVMRSPSTEYHCIGVRAYFDQNIFELLNHVRGRHEVKNKKGS
jgi:lipopolysaccharide export system protein LptC